MTVRTIKPADRHLTDDVRHGEDHDYIEYGIQLPNGRIWWTPGPHPRWGGVDFSRLNLQINQDKAQQSYAEHIEREGVVYDPEAHRLRFVQRRNQIRYTEWETLVGEDLAEFGAAS
jgi:hypothetical protein